VDAAKNMTRCLNCGADRNVDVCEACGLGSSAAEFSLRSKLLNRTAFFLLGAIAFVAASGRYPALNLDEILIFIGVLFFLTLGIAMWVERRALRHMEVEALKRVYYGLIPLPWLLALLLLGNGALDRSPPQLETARVVGKFAMRGPVPSRRLIVNSWREGHRFERVPIDQSDFYRFAAGDVVEVQVKGGLVGIPWVSGVTRP
jgi:hypothetical protein